MLDHVTIFTRGGIVLWSSSFSSLQGDPVNDLVREVLVEERTGQRAFEHGAYTVHWALANELNLVFVAVYQKILQLAYVEDLLASVRRAFTEMFADILADCMTAVVPRERFAAFDAKYATIARKLEERAYSSRATRKPRRFEETKKYQNTLEGSRGKDKRADRGASSQVEESNEDEALSADRRMPRVQRHGKGKRANSSGKKQKPSRWHDGRRASGEMAV
ncbi:signal recognition particle, alpha subunit, N-terminal-domain-containing protein [Syncephalis pseudoplumigaleata]|uniref:Signal recognition particle, alpha subunit, N-terminal-domain-containing protein n=1 Tax=Syncephalis pseudoplumigaleata TaxID=1712513 RepID=A0A4P9YZ47_9FUNG|nr:signal recognition particle, alpha subunit, N-terminal-domain-containing protein [Syncephalis pseudoplumigaleata]|eukprot:RKP24862.1 signal recognition particle, alpha subunit, N-terminal-domain-containing protein [Syncephalis pseudoplumigaleata]